MGNGEPLAEQGVGDEPRVVFSEDEVADLIRLLADALAPDDGRAAKIRRLCDALGHRIDADGWIWIRTRVPTNYGNPQNIDFISGGAFGPEALAEYADWSLEVHGESADNHEIKRRLIDSGRHTTASRPELVSDEIWHSPRYLAHTQRMGLDAFLYSIVPIVEADGATVTSGVMMLRKPGKPDFDARLCRIVHLILAQCGPLHRDGLNVARGEEVAGLTPRLHSVLTLLIDGQSTPQIAERLCLSPYTVGDYVKQIYRHFKVNSRAELLRHFMSGAGKA